MKVKPTREEIIKRRIAFNSLFDIKKGIIKDTLFKCPITGLPTQERPDVRRRRA